VFSHRLATRDDLPALRAVATAAIDELQAGYLEPDQVAASHAIMGIDTRLVDDDTYFVIEDDGAIAGCGGWSRRATLYGGDHTDGRDDALLDPATEPARVRAMYTHPRYARRGVGRLVLSLCEAAAAAEGFRRLELMATLAGEPLYAAYGFAAVEHVSERTTGTSIPLVRMMKPVTAPTTDDFTDAPSAQNSVGSDGGSGTRGSGSGSRSGTAARTSS
jgi:GNAT superfamily N-acetyltransferase